MKDFMRELADLMDKHDIVVIDHPDCGPVKIQGPDLEVWEFGGGIDKHTLQNTLVGAPMDSWSMPGVQTFED